MNKKIIIFPFVISRVSNVQFYITCMYNKLQIIMVENKIILYYKACEMILCFIPLENQSYFHKVDSIFEQQFFNQSLCIKVGKGY